jgi:hypothetical protein
MKLTRSTYRSASRNLKPTVSFGETPAGTPPPVQAWYPDGDTHGREFLY